MVEDQLLLARLYDTFYLTAEMKTTPWNVV
jgi:hypothetical protein